MSLHENGAGYQTSLFITKLLPNLLLLSTVYTIFVSLNRQLPLKLICILNKRRIIFS